MIKLLMEACDKNILCFLNVGFLQSALFQGFRHTQHSSVVGVSVNSTVLREEFTMDVRMVFSS